VGESDQNDSAELKWAGTHVLQSN